MKSFVYYTPTEIVFGKGVEERSVEFVKKYGGSRVMLVYGGGSAVKSGLIGKIENLLKSEGNEVALFGGVKPNPLMSYAREGARKAIEFEADMILAVGGGSAIDTAKAIAHGAANPQTDISQFWKREKELTSSLPVGVVLTISAAGSETSSSAVLTNEETGAKRGLTHDLNRPRFALMNPELTYTLPPYQIACGIADIMMHTLDRHFAITDAEFTTEAGEALLRVVIENGAKAMKNPTDYNAMSELMWCGSVSHNGLTGLGEIPDFSVHQLGHELSAMFDVAHAASLTITWGSWAKYVYKTKPERFARYAEKVWGVERSGDDEKDAQIGIEKTVEYFKSINMPTCFSESEIGVQSDEVISDLAQRCSFYEKRIVGQFKPIDRNDIYNIYSMANV